MSADKWGPNLLTPEGQAEHAEWRAEHREGTEMNTTTTHACPTCGHVHLPHSDEVGQLPSVHQEGRCTEEIPAAESVIGTLPPVACRLRRGHSGPHEDDEGATWFLQHIPVGDL